MTSCRTSSVLTTRSSRGHPLVRDPGLCARVNASTKPWRRRHLARFLRGADPRGSGCPKIQGVDRSRRPDPRHRPDRPRKSTGWRDGRPITNRIRPHPHHRGSDRVRAHLAEVPDQPARGPPRHPRLQRGAAFGAARRPGLHPRRRAARPRDDPPRADRRGDRPPRLRHPAHQLGGEDHRPIIDVPRRREADGALDAVGKLACGDLAVAAEEGRRRPSPRTKSWSASRRSAT